MQIHYTIKVALQKQNFIRQI